MKTLEDRRDIARIIRLMANVAIVVFHFEDHLEVFF